MKVRNWLISMGLMFASLPGGLSEGTEEEFEGLESVMEALRDSSSQVESGEKNAPALVDERGRMETVLLRYRALRKRLELVPERNEKRFQIELDLAMQKAPPPALLDKASQPLAEIVDLRTCRTGVKENDAKERSSKNRIEEISRILDGIANELLQYAADFSEGE